MPRDGEKKVLDSFAIDGHQGSGRRKHTIMWELHTTEAVAYTDQKYSSFEEGYVTVYQSPAVWRDDWN